MDFIADFPKSKGFEAIFVVVNRFSKYNSFTPLKQLYITKAVEEVFARETICFHGLPVAIVSDKYHIFVSNFLRELFRI